MPKSPSFTWSSLLGLGMLFAVLPNAGCTRSADDRVPPPDQFQRAELHGPNQAAIAYRRVDRARKSGNVVIVTSGYEPVYVRDAAYFELPLDPTTTSNGTQAEVLDRLQKLENRLAAVSTAAKPVDDGKAESSAPVTPPPQPERVEAQPVKPKQAGMSEAATDPQGRSSAEKGRPCGR